MQSWRSIASAAALLFAANACGSGTISGGDDTPVAGLRFTVQPTSGAAGQTFSVSVELLNSAGQKIGNADDNVALTINGGGDLLGTLNKAAVSGVATFTGLSVTRAGTGFTITASSGTATPTSSSSFTITPANANAGQSSASFTPSPVTAGATIAVVFTFKDQFGNPVPSKPVTLSSSLAGVTFTPSSGTTSATGTFSTNMVATTAGSANLSATVDGVALTLPTPVTITAPVGFTITTSSNPVNGGTTSGGGTFNSGASVTVVATPATGFTFTNWTEGGAAVSTNASFNFTAAANRTLVANFTATADACNPLSLTFPGTLAATVSASSGCTVGTLPAAHLRFTTSQGVTGGHAFSVASTGFTDPVLEVTSDPPGTANMGFINSTNPGTVASEWILPPGTYRVRVSSVAGGTGAFTVTGAATSGVSNNGSGCSTGVALRSFVVGGTYTGQTLGTGDCAFTGGILVDVFFIRSLKPCTIVMTPTGFDAVIQARNFGLTTTVGFEDDFDVGGAETLALASCSTNGASIALMASAFLAGETGSYTLTITITGGGSLIAATLPNSERPTVDTFGPMSLGDVFRATQKRKQ